jgi:hypothetical protein
MRNKRGGEDDTLGFGLAMAIHALLSSKFDVFFSMNFRFRQIKKLIRYFFLINRQNLATRFIPYFFFSLTMCSSIGVPERPALKGDAP